MKSDESIHPHGGPLVYVIGGTWKSPGPSRETWTGYETGIVYFRSFAIGLTRTRRAVRRSGGVREGRHKAGVASGHLCRSDLGLCKGCADDDQGGILGNQLLHFPPQRV